MYTFLGDRFGWEEEGLTLPGPPSPREEEGDDDQVDGAEGHLAPGHGALSQVGVAKKYDPTRFNMFFKKESVEEIEARKKAAATIPITAVPEVGRTQGDCVVLSQQSLPNSCRVCIRLGVLSCLWNYSDLWVGL